MKKSLIFGYLLILQFCSFAQKKFDHYKFAGMIDKPTGNIKTVVEQSFKFVNKAIADSHFLDPDNMVLQKMVRWEVDTEKRTLLDFHHNLKDTNNYNSQNVFRFDSLANLIYYSLSFKGFAGSFITSKLKYDSFGRLIEDRNYQTAGTFKDSLISRETYKYDRKGNLIENARFAASKKMGLSERYGYTYDNNSNCLSKTVYVDTNSSSYKDASPCEKNAEKYVTSDKGYYSKKIKEYENNKLVHTFDVSRNGCIDNRTRIAYDNNGDKVQVLTYAHGGVAVDQWSGKYIDHRLVLETTLHGSGSGAWIDSCRQNYDSSGNLVETIKFTSKGTPYNIVKYTYDNFHNWVTKLVIVNNELVEFTRRRIIYYGI